MTSIFVQLLGDYVPIYQFYILNYQEFIQFDKIHILLLQIH